jgi:hypothetical protein
MTEGVGAPAAGLSDAEAARRLAADGPNTLPDSHRRGWTGILAEAAGEPMFLPTTTGLHLLVDSTGIKMLGEGEWKRKKHGADDRRQWRKVHPGMDDATLEIRTMEVTGNSIVTKS